MSTHETNEGLQQRIMDLEGLTNRLIGKVRTVSLIRPDGVVNGRDLLASLEREAQNYQPLPGRDGYIQELLRKNAALEEQVEALQGDTSRLDLYEGLHHQEAALVPYFDDSVAKWFVPPADDDQGDGRTFETLREALDWIPGEADQRVKAAQAWLKGIEQEYGGEVADKCEDILMEAESRKQVEGAKR
jgi:hypothetical protein